MGRNALRPALALLIAAPVASADVLVLRDGRLFDGVALEPEEGAVVVAFEHGRVRVPEAAVLECVLDDEAGVEPASEEEREKRADGYVRYDGKWMRKERRDKLVEELRENRRAAIEQRKDARLWRNARVEETDHFRFQSTVPPNVFESYRDQFEAYFQEFSKLWRVRRPRGLDKLDVKFYIDKEAYMQTTGVSPYVLGFFRPLEPYELNIYYDRLDPLQTEEVMFHEASHYLQLLFDVEFWYPHWPGEALAEYYGASTWDPETRTFVSGGVQEGRLIEIQRDMEEGDWVRLRDLLLEAPERTYTDYNWGWSLVHFLMNDRRRSGDFKKFFVALANARDIDREPRQFGGHHMKTVSGEAMLAAFQKYMKLKSDRDLEELQEEWYAYLRESLAVTTPRGLADAAWLAVRRDRPLRARRLFEEAIAAGNDHSLTCYRYGYVLDELDEEASAREQWARAIELDPLVPEYYIALGKSLAGEPATGEEGERLLHLAQDIEPDNFYLERNLSRLLSEARKERKKKAKKAETAPEAGDGEASASGDGD